MSQEALVTPRPRRSPRPRLVTVVGTERLSASMIRVVLGGADLADLDEPVHADSYVKLVFLDPETTYPDPLDIDEVRATLPRRVWPRLRTYTIRSFDRAAQEITIDFVVHGDSGLAGPWAARAEIGDRIHLLGPGGGFDVDPAADHHLLVGDESALPAIAVAQERIPAGAEVTTIIEVYGPADEMPMPLPVTWVHRGMRPVGQALVEEVGRLDLSPQGFSGFVHGEAGFVRELRRRLVKELRIPLTQLSISGYWRVGADDEQWRSVKREWNESIEREETAVG